MRRKQYYNEGEEFIIDLENLWIDDLEVIQESFGENAKWKSLLDVMDRLVVGGVRGRHIPLTKIGELNLAIMDAINEMTNPEVEGKN